MRTKSCEPKSGPFTSMPSAYHNATSGSIERGNVLGDRSSVRQSRYFRQYESGNNVKDLLGTGHLRWHENQKEGVFGGHAVYDGRTQDYDYDALSGSRHSLAPPQGVHQPLQQQLQPAPSQHQALQHYQQGAPPPPPQHCQVPPPEQQEPQQQAQQQASATRARGRGGSLDHLADALWNAVGGRDLAEVQKLLRQGGADPNMVCPDGWVRDECRPKAANVGRSVLHHAAWAGDLRIFKCLVDAGADVDRRRNTAWRPNGGVRGRGATPLHHACQYNRVDIVLYLLDELGCDINAPGEQGYTPLHLAAKFAYPKLAELLLQRGARTDMLTKDEKTPRDLAGAKQERSHAQMGDMLQLFDRYDAEARTRPKLPPGAPLPQDPRLAARQEPMASDSLDQWQQQQWQQRQQQQQQQQQQAPPPQQRQQWQQQTPPPPPPPPLWQQHQTLNPPPKQQQPYSSQRQPLPPQQYQHQMYDQAKRYDQDAAHMAAHFQALGMGASKGGGHHPNPNESPHPTGGGYQQQAGYGRASCEASRGPSRGSAGSDAGLRADQVADQAAALTRARAAGSRPW